MKAEEFLKENYPQTWEDLLHNEVSAVIRDNVVSAMEEYAQSQLHKEGDEFGPVDLTDVEPDRIRLPKEGECKLKNVADNYAKYGPPEARQINRDKRNTFMHGALWQKNHCLPKEGEEVDWNDIEVEFWERFKGEQAGHQTIFDWFKRNLKRTTISLPTEEEIENEAANRYGDGPGTIPSQQWKAFVRGAKWALTLLKEKR